MASKRTFGVEIECGHDSYTDDRLGEVMTEAGFPTSFTWTKDKYGHGRDGSGIEIKTPILQGEKGYRELERIMDFLSDQGCWVSNRDGMHVHIGAKGFDKNTKACARLARSWYSNQSIIQRMCAGNRARSGHCGPVQAVEVPNLGQMVKSEYRSRPFKNYGERKSLNLQPLEDYGTIEFRLHEGCLNPAKAIAWVKFCQALVDHSWNGKEPLKCAGSKTALLTTLGVPRDARAHLAKRQLRAMPPRPARLVPARAPW